MIDRQYGEITYECDAVPRGDLDIILEWYGGLSPGARQNLSLADLHGLSKRLGAPAGVRL